MELLTVVLIAVGLSMDCFAVALCVGTTPHSTSIRSRLRLAFHFGIFQGLMTFLGWVVGSSMVRFIGQFDHWIALILLGYVGINMIRSGVSGSAQCFQTDPSRGRTMVMLSVATSIDALAVGLTVGMLGEGVVYPSILIGLITFIISMVGLFLGRRLGERFGKRMEVIGGVLLSGMGLRIVLTHLL